MSRVFASALWFSLALSFVVQAEDSLLVIDAESWLNPENQHSFQAKVVMAVLNQYKGEYEISVMPRNRARQTLSTHPAACSPWMLKNAERETKFSYSLPYMMESSLKLVLSKNSSWGKELLRLSNNQSVSLYDILSLDQSPILGIESERSYGEATDGLLKQLGEHKTIYKRTSSSDTAAQLKPMLHRGFIDMMIEYSKIKEEEKEDFNSFYYFDYKEAEPFQLVYFACSKTEFVKPLIDKLNLAIAALSQHNEYQNIILGHLPEQDRERALRFWLNAFETTKTIP